MIAEPSIANVAAILAVPARANILAALFDGRPLPAGSLAELAGVTRQTTSHHLAVLLNAKLVTCERKGRIRLYRLAGPHVAEALEPLTHLSTHRPIPTRGNAGAGRALREARLCYDHLAGQLGVAVTAAMIDQKLLSDGGREFRLAAVGEKFVAGLGIDIEVLRNLRRCLALKCLDWSERRPHLAGSLGAALAAEFMRRRWIVRLRQKRCVAVTALGRAKLKALLDLDFSRQ
jgi:DNA-binding transcriptional ArsR family regulator